MNKQDVIKMAIEYCLYAIILALATVLIIIGARFQPPQDTLIAIGSSLLAATLGKIGISISKTTNKKE